MWESHTDLLFRIDVKMYCTVGENHANKCVHMRMVRPAPPSSRSCASMAWQAAAAHFVVIAGKDGFDYLVRDRGAGSAKGLYALRELGSDIEGLRFYKPIGNAHFHVSIRR